MQFRIGKSATMFLTVSQPLAKGVSTAAATVGGGAAAGVKAPLMKTGILVHGYHLEASGWEQVMWGDEGRQRLGRLPHLVKVAAQEDPVVVVFSTGASERNGKKEGQVIYEYLDKHWHDLRGFQEAFSGTDLEALRSRLLPRCVINTEPTNTKQELAAAGAVFARAGVRRVILISSPTHLPRCLRDASSLWGTTATAGAAATPKDTPTGSPGVRAGAAAAAAWAPSVLLCSPSDTSYPGSEPADVAVVEPPHRGDRDPALDGLPLHSLVNRMFTLPAKDRAAFQRELHELLSRYES